MIPIPKNQILYTIRGKVRKGKQRGKQLGFPTANIALHQTIPEGVYVSTVSIKRQRFIAAAFIGPAKTFGEQEYQLESYIIDFDISIYDEWMTVRLMKKLRGNNKFSSPDELIKQIRSDIQETKSFFDISNA